MTQRIIVLGAGYAGLTAANRLARRLRGVEMTLVNDRPTFVERVRLHQVAAGQRPKEHLLADRVRDGIGLSIGRVTAIDPDRHEVRLGDDVLGYDTLVYALGSTASVPERARAALTVAGAEDSTEAGKRIADLAAERGTLAVVGGGLTGIEAAAEFAETHPGLRVRLVTHGEPGPGLSANGQRHVRRVFDRLGVEVVTDAAVEEVREDAVVLRDGREISAGLTVWSTGFGVPEAARRAGLEVDERGRVRVDSTLRSRSHPDVYAIGDAAAATRANGVELRMACATGLPSACCAADAIAARLTGREPRPLRFRYVNQCVSLGRRDALIQYVDADDRPHRTIITGRAAARYKEAIVRGALAMTAKPGPYSAARRRAAE
ncbi:NAD(P)/FAD-dependent oxidoreductase [Prauserella cavernicola]|uniref:FAD-dependent oxidoreductase n=1 Tax=Prauserella cavernicola TaxID=2800127 RepID=A0A934QU07_9PSEU|nr:FAD-dependent oxidoreductase [Prauserella cavernicola]MBK1786288.1 FAD-dependent oxidoreductase [Prauserella cavernicola]